MQFHRQRAASVYWVLTESMIPH